MDLGVETEKAKGNGDLILGDSTGAQMKPQT
jgi:hypothetical protein